MRPAVVQLNVVNNGVSLQKHLCQSCVARYTPGLNMQLGAVAPMVPFHVLNAVASQAQMPVPYQSVPTGPGRCEHCGYPFSMFQQNGMLGCALCYDSFAPQMPAILRRAQGGALKHSGKVPRRRLGEHRTQRQVEDLQRQLEQAIKEERYEDAAVLRDRVRSLRQGGEDEGGFPPDQAPDLTP